RNVDWPRNPFVTEAVVQPAIGPPPVGSVLHMNPHGFGFIAAREFRRVPLVQLAPESCAVSPACEPGLPLRNARKIGSGCVPGAPVYANVAPRPAARLAWRFAWAVRKSCGERV